MEENKFWLMFWGSAFTLLGLPLIGAVYHSTHTEHIQRMACLAARGNWEGRAGVQGATAVQGCRFAATKP